jgi:hypothetical protein
MGRSVGSRFAVVAVLAAAIFTWAPARAEDYDYQLRLRLGGYFPTDLPTTEGTIWGIELRDYMNSRSGIAYQLGYFNEQRTAFMALTSGPGAPIFTFHAKVQIVPILFTWFHVWPLPRTDFYYGVGGGIYVVKATSAGFNKQLGVGVRDVGDFRFLTDGSNPGLVVYSGFDFFPQSRWGITVEGRAHIVSAGYSAAEFSTGAILRF